MAEDILKAYLVAIGFKVDEQDYKKFKDSQLDTEKRTKNLSKAFSDFAKVGIGASVALGGMVIKVSNDLEKLHFQAQKSGTSAQNLKSFGEAAENIGIQAGDAMGMVEQLNNKIQSNKLGMGALLGNLGVNANQDKVKVVLDLVDSLAKIQQTDVTGAIVPAFASQFGISDEDIRTLIRGREELHKIYEQRRGVNENIDAQALAAHKANEEFRQLADRFTALNNAMAVGFLPTGRAVASFLEAMVKDLIEADKYTNGWSTAIYGLGTALAGTMGSVAAFRAIMGIGGATGGVTGAVAGTGGLLTMGGLGAGIGGGLLAKWGIDIYSDTLDIKSASTTEGVASGNRIEEQMARNYFAETGKKPSDNYLAYAAWKKAKSGGKKTSIQSSVTGDGKTSVMGLIDKYADRYGIDPALLEAQAYQESRYNPNALSSKGAMGVMQLMPKTAKGLGVDPHNTEQNIEGGARMMAGLLKKYHGDTSLALAAYNAGETAVDRAHGVPRIAETQDYVASIHRRMATQASGNTVSVKMDQKTEINVNGSGDANKTADLVASEQNKVNSGLARDFAGAVQ